MAASGDWGQLAADFATRLAAHNRDASHPVENYARLREEWFLALTIGKELGGLGASLLVGTAGSDEESEDHRPLRARFNARSGPPAC